MKPLPAIPNDIRGKRALVRVDFNVPLADGRVADDFRILQTLPGIRELQEKGARVILLSHLETDGDQPSTKEIGDYLSQTLKNFSFVSDISGETAQNAVGALGDGDGVLLENVRRDPGEVSNDEKFAKRLASLGDFYVNEAFSVSHRAHASVVGIPRFLPSYAGPLFRAEVEHLSRAFNPPHPFLFIVGGKKISTKAPLIKAYAGKADVIALGSSFVAQREDFSDSSTILRVIDVVVERAGSRETVMLDAVLPNDHIYDLGPKTTAEIARHARASKMIVWNGPVGFFEAGFAEGTHAVAQALADSGAEVIVGGGETVQFIRQFGYWERFSFVSTGGGAMLDFLANQTLPGIEALQKA